MDGSYTEVDQGDENDDDEYPDIMSPMSNKRLKVSDINISRYINRFLHILIFFNWSQFGCDDMKIKDLFSRYEEEFVELDKIASGQFGVVKKARHRLDGMVYAIKMTKKPLRDNTRSEKTAMKEIFAGAAMMKHKHIVRYYNSWVENRTVFIQNEFCDGGSVQRMLEQHRRDGCHVGEETLWRLMSDVSSGLQYVHSKHLAHMDVKPDNILICSGDQVLTSGDDTGDTHLVTFKLADFGHVVPTYGEDVEPEEGDCRYMAPELLSLSIERSGLTCADIFSLGLTCYEVASLRVMPRNSLDDPEYFNIKNGIIPRVDRYSDSVNTLIADMVTVDPGSRPTAAHVVKCCQKMCGTRNRRKLYKELEQTKEKLNFLENKLLHA